MKIFLAILIGCSLWVSFKLGESYGYSEGMHQGIIVATKYERGL